MPSEELQRRTKIANGISRSGVTVDVEEVGVGPLSIESSIEEYMSIGPMLERMLEIRKEGRYDAIIIGCAGDPGLRPARELLDIPVIGPAESSYLFASMVADRFSVVSTLQAGEESEDGVRLRTREIGLDAKLASVEFAKVSVADMWNDDSGPVIEMIREAANRAKKKGAGCIVLGCMSMAFHLIDEALAHDPIPVINPLKTAIKAAETFIDLGIGHSRVTYPGADFEKLKRTLFTEK
jgi:allantoin racemase